jgi:hypothetical protein
MDSFSNITWNKFQEIKKEHEQMTIEELYLNLADALDSLMRIWRNKSGDILTVLSDLAAYSQLVAETYMLVNKQTRQLSELSTAELSDIQKHIMSIVIDQLKNAQPHYPMQYGGVAEYNVGFKFTEDERQKILESQ